MHFSFFCLCSGVNARTVLVFEKLEMLPSETVKIFSRFFPFSLFFFFHKKKSVTTFLSSVLLGSQEARLFASKVLCSSETGRRIW